MGFSGAGQHVPPSGVTAAARLFSISVSKERGEGGKENQHKNRKTLVYFSMLSGAWGLKTK